MDANMIGAYGPWAAGLVDGPPRLSFRRARSRPATLTRGGPGRECGCTIACSSPTLARARGQLQHQLVNNGLHVEHLTWQLPYGPPTEAVFFKPSGAPGRLPPWAWAARSWRQQVFRLARLRSLATRSTR